jgi:hypothetical protein
LTGDGLYLGDQKWEHGMRYPGINELISATYRYGEDVLRKNAP